MSDHQKKSADEEAARALSWKLFLLVLSAAAAFSGTVFFFIL